MLKPLLTPAQVADLLHLSRRKVLSLDLPKVRVGDGRGKILFSEDDVRDYLRSRTEYPVTKEQRCQPSSEKIAKNGAIGSSYTGSLGSDTPGILKRTPRTRRRNKGHTFLKTRR